MITTTASKAAYLAAKSDVKMPKGPVSETILPLR